MTNRINTRGTHLVCELSRCNPETLGSVNAVKHALESAAAAANATALNGYFHQFSPSGISGVLCLAESHISVHTWPECNYAAVDIYTCGDSTVPHRAISILSAAFEAKEIQIREISRGIAGENNTFGSEDVSHKSPKAGRFMAPGPENANEHKRELPGKSNG